MNVNGLNFDLIQVKKWVCLTLVDNFHSVSLTVGPELVVFIAMFCTYHLPARLVDNSVWYFLM